MQTEQIEDLQDDVEELRAKLNLLVTDITHATNGLTVKLNQAIVDAGNLNDVINEGYTTASGAGSSSVGILKRLDELFQDMEDHRYLPTAETAPGGSTYKESHPPANSGSPVWQTGGTSVSNLSGTAQGNNNDRSAHVATAQSVSAAAPVYIPKSTTLITLKTISEKRAKKLARKIQGQITEEDRVNTNK
jgi:hypothetical protein